MAMYEEDMSQVAAPDEMVPPGAYHVRVKSVEDDVSQAGKPVIIFTFAIQDEGPAYGRTVRVWASRQPNALFTLKGIYKACNYNPVGGHDPDNVLDCELYLTVVHDIRKDTGEPGMKIPPSSFKSLTDGPWQPKK